MDKFNYLKEQLTAALATWQQTNGGKTTVGWMHAANPEVIEALLAELEAKDKQNKLLMREVEHGKKLRVNMQNNADSLSERITELSQLLAHNIKLADEAEAKLATPVRLPKRWDVSGQVNPPRIVEVQFEQQNRTHDQCAKAIRDAGFTVVVEGDE